MHRGVRAALVVLPALCVPAAAGPSLEGRWEVAMERPGGTPRACHALLVLTKAVRGWEGTITFRVLTNGAMLPLENVRVGARRLAFDHRARRERARAQRT